MMDGGCLTDIRKTLAEKLVNKAIEKSRNIFCFTCIVKEFNEEKEKLEAGRVTMREQFQEATKKGKGIKTNARFWEEQANKLIQENTETEKSCANCLWRYKRGEELATKTKEIRKLMEEKFENVELARPLLGVERHSSQYYIPFKSRELKHKELLDALTDDSNYITGLYGMGGTGKTTLVNEVGKQLKTSEQFALVIDTTVSSTPKIKKIQDDIAGSLGLEWGDINESDRPKKLWSRLTNGEKILVILDDVWENLKFDDIGIPNSDNHKALQEKRFLTATYVIEKNAKLLQNVFFSAKKISLHVVGISAVAKSFATTFDVAVKTNAFATTIIVDLCHMSQ